MKSETFPVLGKYRPGWVIFWALAAMLVFALASGMDVSIRNFPLTWMFFLGMIAFLLAWILSGSQRKSTLLFIIGLSSGLFILMLLNSGAGRNLFLTFVHGFRLDKYFEPFKRYPVDADIFLFFLQNSITSLFNTSKDLFTWTCLLFSNSARFDTNISEIFWGTILWSASFSSGWLFRRKKHALVASLPIITLLIGILGYTRQKTTGLALGLSALLMMIVIFEHLRHENDWTLNKIDYSEEIRMDIAFTSIPIIAAILMIAIILPNISFDAIKEFSDRFIVIRDQNQIQIERPLGLKITPQKPADQKNTGILPRELLIGSGPELSENIVMEIDTGEIFLPPQIDMENSLPNYYWFGRSYDVYTGKGWLTSEIYQKNYSKNEIIVPADMENSRLLNLKIDKTNRASTTLYASGPPLSVDHRIIVGWYKTTDEYYSAEIDGSSYQVQSPITVVSEEDLQQSTGQIPEIILKIYLQIPETTPARVRDLASTLTEDLQNPYDKAKAIEDFLRQYDYTLDVPKPTPNQDVVDFFLFDLQRGYCDYFASTMVVLSRSIGLPARLAVGYTAGNYDYTRQMFVVTEANAHAWPEIYIAPYGWIPFEPTTSEAPFAWDLKNPPLPTGQIEDYDMDQQVNPFWLNLLILTSILLVILITGFLWYKITSIKTHKKPTNQQLEGIYRRMEHFLSYFWASPQPSRTPYEFQKEIELLLEQHETSKMEKRIIKPITSNIQFITGLYVQGIYSPAPVSNHEMKLAKKNLFKIFTQTLLLNLIFVFTR